MATTLPYTTSSLSKVALTKPVYHISLSENSSVYEKILHKKNVQLKELKFYIKNIARSLSIEDLLHARIQYH